MRQLQQYLQKKKCGTPPPLMTRTGAAVDIAAANCYTINQTTKYLLLFRVTTAELLLVVGTLLCCLPLFHRTEEESRGEGRI